MTMMDVKPITPVQNAEEIKPFDLKLSERNLINRLRSYKGTPCIIFLELNGQGEPVAMYKFGEARREVLGKSP